MKRLRKVIVLTGLTLLAVWTLAVTALWVRSYWTWDQVIISRAVDPATQQQRTEWIVNSLSGLLTVSVDRAHVDPLLTAQDGSPYGTYFNRNRQVWEVRPTPGRSYVSGILDKHPAGRLGFGAHRLDHRNAPVGDTRVLHWNVRWWVAPTWVLLIGPGLLWFWLAIRWTRRRRQHRRRDRGLCPQCGYDLRATPGRCPECGHVADQHAAP